MQIGILGLGGAPEGPGAAYLMQVGGRRRIWCGRRGWAGGVGFVAWAWGFHIFGFRSGGFGFVLVCFGVFCFVLV